MKNPNPEELDVEVFRAGDYGERGNYDTETLGAIARDYDPGRHEAPVTFDHEQRGPAHGWVRRLRLMGDRLVASLRGLSPRLARSLRERRFPKRSVELYRRFTGTGRPYLKAVSFLGAAAPAVKGLRDPVFSAEGGTDEAPTACFVEELPPPADAPPEAGDSSPCPAAAEAKARLMALGRWLPEWEERGLPAVFAALADREELDALVAVLSTVPPPVSFEPLGTLPEGSTATFSETLTGGASPESVQHHRRAMERIRRDPELSYRDALIHETARPQDV